MEVGRPEALAVHGAHVGGERVEPHIKDVRRLTGHGDSPFEIGPGNGEIGEAALYKRHHFVPACIGLDEQGFALVEFEKPVLEFGKLEEEVLFGYRLCRPSAIRTRIAGLGIIHVEVVVDTILACIGSLVDIAVAAAPLEQILDYSGMLRTRGALKE